MPNWTANRIRVTGNDSKKIQEIKELFEGGDPFNTLIPEPKWEEIPLSEQYEKSAGAVIGNLGELPTPADPTKDFSFPTFASTGHQDDRWYYWRNANWNTKWGACDIEITKEWEETDVLEITFNTAWSPPVPIANKLRSKYETKNEDYYNNGQYVSISWLYELEGEDGVGYI